MNTKNFNLLDKLIANLRLASVLKYVDTNDSVLDFGCGSYSFLLNRVKNKISFGTGLDCDIKNGKQGNIDYRRYRFKGKLPFKNGSFDKIFLLAVLEHIEPEKVKLLFREFNRILKEGGKIVLTTPTPRSKFWLEFLAFRLNIICREEILDHKKYYTKEDLRGVIRNSGIKLVKYRLFQLGLNSCVVLEKVS